MSYYSTSPGTRTTLLYSIELARLLIVRSLLLYAYGIAYCNRATPQGGAFIAFARGAKGVRVAHGIEAGNASSYLLLEHGL